MKMCIATQSTIKVFLPIEQPMNKNVYRLPFCTAMFLGYNVFPVNDITILPTNKPTEGKTRKTPGLCIFVVHWQAEERARMNHRCTFKMWPLHGRIFCFFILFFFYILCFTKRGSKWLLDFFWIAPDQTKVQFDKNRATTLSAPPTLTDWDGTRRTECDERVSLSTGFNRLNHKHTFFTSKLVTQCYTMKWLLFFLGLSWTFLDLWLLNKQTVITLNATWIRVGYVLRLCYQDLSHSQESQNLIFFLLIYISMLLPRKVGIDDWRLHIPSCLRLQFLSLSL